MSQRLGDLLVKEKVITPEQLAQATKVQKETNCRLGSALVKWVEYRLIDIAEERTVGTVDDAVVFAVAHPGAVYLHQGQQYRVDRLDLREHVAVLEPLRRRRVHACRVRRPTSRSWPRSASAAIGESVVHLGAVEVKSHVIAYQRKQVSTNRVIEVCDLDLPERGARDPCLLVHRSARGARARRHRRPDGCSARFTRPSTG